VALSADENRIAVEIGAKLRADGGPLARAVRKHARRARRAEQGRKPFVTAWRGVAFCATLSYAMVVANLHWMAIAFLVVTLICIFFAVTRNKT
jgi:hypothetical protein